MSPMSRHSHLAIVCAAAGRSARPRAEHARTRRRASPPRSICRPTSRSCAWAQDPTLLDREAGDRLEQRQVLARAAQDREAQERGAADPLRVGRRGHPAEHDREAARRCSTACATCRTCGCTSSVTPTTSRCRPRSPGVYGDNEGLSRERAGEVAEFLQTALALPPEAISFEWAGDSQPIASNATDEGRAQNRRVEVEVWYDESETRLAHRGGRRPRGHQARQGLPHRDGLQAALPRGPRAPRARART